MSDQQPAPANAASVEDVAASLWRRAADLWGAERASALGHVVDNTAEDVWAVSQVTLSDSDEPAFYPRWRRARHL